MRNVDPTIVSLFESADKSAIMMVEIDWPTGTVRMHDGVGPQYWDNQTWHGVGSLGSISELTEGETVGDAQLNLVTNDTALIAEAVKDDAAGSQVKIYLGVLNEFMQVSAVALMYSGYINETPVQYKNPPTISVDLVDLEHRWGAPKQYTRYTAAAQRSIYPTDSYCDDVERIAKGPLSSYSAGNSVGRGRLGNQGGRKIP